MATSDKLPTYEQIWASSPAIVAHLAAHEKKIARKRKARVAADTRKKKRGLAAAVASMGKRK